MKFRKGSKLLYKDGREAYEKVDDEDYGQWVDLLAKYPIETFTNDVPPVKEVEMRSDNDLPLYKPDGSLNRRFWFRWSDEQVAEHYGEFMMFDIK